MARTTKAQKQEMMLTQDIKTLIPMMAVPTIVAQLITTIYNIVDSYFVSTLGTNATAAVGVNSSLERSITLIGSLIGAGACSYISRLLGAKKQGDADRVLSTSFFSGLGLGVLFMIICRLSINSLVYLLGATDACAPFSVDYANYVLYAAPFMIGSFILNMCLRSEGSAMFAMVGIGIGGVLNCFLDPLFIYGGQYGSGNIFGLEINGFGLGVAGASMATALSKFISFCILLVPYIRKKTNVTIALKKIKFLWDDIKNVLTIGSASFFRSAMSVVATVTINNVAGGISTSALAALSIANRIMEFPFAIILGFGMGYQPVVGFNWGAKQMKRVKESLTFSCMVSVVGAIVMGVILFFGSAAIVPVFNKQADAEVLQYGLLCIRLQCVALVFHAWGGIINMFYAGIGKGKQALAMSTARQGYCFIPVALIAPMLMGGTGVAATQAIADVLSMAVAIPLTIGAFKLIQQKTDEVAAETANEKARIA